MNPRQLLQTVGSPMPTSYDAIVIGTGQAGPSLAARLAKAGRRTAVIERKRFGGTCVNVGCIPDQDAGRQRARHPHGAAGCRVRLHHRKCGQRGHGAREGAEGRDRPPVVRRRRALDAADPEPHRLRRPRPLRGTRTVTVNNEVLEAEQIFINVGARAIVPDLTGGTPVPMPDQHRHPGAGRPARSTC